MEEGQLLIILRRDPFVLNLSKEQQRQRILSGVPSPRDKPKDERDGGIR